MKITWFNGISYPIILLKQYINADNVIAFGALQLPQTS